MSIRRLLLSIGVGTTLGLLASAGFAADAKPEVRLSAGQGEFLWQEPIFVRVEAPTAEGLPAAPVSGALRFEIEPAVKPRPNAKPLPQEAREASAKARDFDLLEWFQFPEQGGTWTVRAVLEQGGNRIASAPITVAVHKPGAKEADFPAMARLHHMPWSNYDTNKFCGDTFDVVKNWPDSRFAKYCHYWNGRFLQNEKDYAKAIASFRAVTSGSPSFPLFDDAERGIAECEQASAAK